MPLKNVSPMDQKQRFVSLAGSGHFTMTELCRDFGISRKTGHKWVARHAVGGMPGLEEHSRAPKSVTCRPSDEVERLICTEKRLRSTWGPKKIQQILMTNHGLESPPAVSTVGEVLKRHSWVAERRRRSAVFKMERGALTTPERPNHVLGVDFKGWSRADRCKRNRDCPFLRHLEIRSKSFQGFRPEALHGEQIGRLFVGTPADDAVG